ncbi:hypothetical protein D3C86_1717030 [compost metagenome]
MRVQAEPITWIKATDIQVAREFPARIEVGVRADAHDDISPFGLFTDLDQSGHGEVGSRSRPSGAGKGANAKETRRAMHRAATQFFLVRDIVDGSSQASQSNVGLKRQTHDAALIPTVRTLIVNIAAPARAIEGDFAHEDAFHLIEGFREGDMDGRG